MCKGEPLPPPAATYTISARSKTPDSPVFAFLRNHYGNDEYEQNLPLLKKYHRPGNSVIVTNDDLARWIRQDFPAYHVDASVIKNIKTHRKIDEALKLYDSIVLPMRLNEDLEFLEKIEAKDRITLFANAGCALTCLRSSVTCRFRSSTKVMVVSFSVRKCSRIVSRWAWWTFHCNHLSISGFTGSSCCGPIPAE